MICSVAMDKIKLTSVQTSEHFRKPFDHGWKREVVYSNIETKKAEISYVSPDGKRVRTKQEIEAILESGLDINMFSFAKRPLGFDDELVRVSSGRGYRKPADSDVPLKELNLATQISDPNDMRENSAKRNAKSIHFDVPPPEKLNLATQIKDPNEGDMCHYDVSDPTEGEMFAGSAHSDHITTIFHSDTSQTGRSPQKYALMDADELRQVIAEKDNLIENLQICLSRNESQLKTLQNKIKTKTDITNVEILNLTEILFPMLTKNQISIMTKQKKRVNWTCEEISIGFALSFFSRRGYEYLINKLEYALPSIRTLQVWSQNMNINPGILNDSFVVLQALRNSLTEGESQVILGFDEMKCRERWEYNKTLDCIMGPHSQMQTVMVRGLFSKFKQPIYVDFDRKMTKDLLISIIQRLHNIRLNVVGIVNDNGGGNVGLWTECDVDFETSYILHPDTDEKVFMFSDAPHLLKLLRNWFIDGGFLLLDGTELNQYPIRQLLETNTEISPLYKLSLHHLEVKGAERQCVRIASELFSHTVAESLRRNFPGDKVVQKLSDFIELVNNWFDIMNSYTPNGIAYKAPYGSNLEEQDRVLDEMYSTIKTMKCYNKKSELQQSLQIFQKGILMSITSIKELRKEMEHKFGFKYILTHRSNQDCLENLFSQVRGRNGSNDHPTPVELLYTIKSIILGKNPGLSRHLHTNTIERDPEEYVSAIFMKQLSQDGNVNGVCEQRDVQCEGIRNVEFLENYDESGDVPLNSENEDYADDLATEFLQDYSNDVEALLHDSNEPGTCIQLEIQILDEISSEFLDDLSTEMIVDEVAARRSRCTEDGLEYLAGWIAWKFRKSNPEFSKSRRETLPSYITDHTYAKRIGIQSSSWIDCVSYGGLTKPNDEVSQWVQSMENVFIAQHGDEFTDRDNIKKKLIYELTSECPDIPSPVINLYARSRIYMRCKYLNKLKEEKALLARILKRHALKRKATPDSLDDASRGKAKKMKKIVS